MNKHFPLTPFIIFLIINIAIGLSFYFSYNTNYALLIWLLGFLINILIIFIIVSIVKKNIEQQTLNEIYKHLQNILTSEKQIIIKQKKDLLDYIDNIYHEILKEREKFKQLDSYRKEYLGNVSHELKTPLFNVQGYISTLLDDGYIDEKILLEYLKKADKNVERMINIIDDLETISQLESGAMMLDYEQFDIVALITEVFEQMEISAHQKNIKLKLIKQNDYCFVNADKFRIRQVLSNLISNSIKYGKDNGTTEVHITTQKNKAIITVSDNGIGIEEKHLPRIFERFYRVDKGRSREQGGTGLGLAIVKHIIEAHKQTISVKSKPSSGTSFTFTLDSM